MNFSVLCFLPLSVYGSSGYENVDEKHKRLVYGHIRLMVESSHACVTLPPARAKSPVHKRSLCTGCISLSNAEGFGRYAVTFSKTGCIPEKAHDIIYLRVGISWLRSDIYRRAVSLEAAF